MEKRFTRKTLNQIEVREPFKFFKCWSEPLVNQEEVEEISSIIRSSLDPFKSEPHLEFTVAKEKYLNYNKGMSCSVCYNVQKFIMNSIWIVIVFLYMLTSLKEE